MILLGYAPNLCGLGESEIPGRLSAPARTVNHVPLLAQDTAHFRP